MLYENFSNTEKNRLRTLNDYNILDTEPEQCFAEITLLVSQFCETSQAGVSIVDNNRLWFMSMVEFDYVEIPCEETFCSLAIHQYDLLVVSYAVENERYNSNFEVAKEVVCRFFTGIRSINLKGFVLGTFFLHDTIQRELNEKKKYSGAVMTARLKHCLNTSAYPCYDGDGDARAPATIV